MSFGLERLSIRWRLALTSAALTFVILAAFAIGVYQVTTADSVIFRWQGTQFDAPTSPVNFEAELRRSGLWEMMERCYPTPQAQAQ